LPGATQGSRGGGRTTGVIHTGAARACSWWPAPGRPVSARYRLAR